MFSAIKAKRLNTTLNWKAHKWLLMLSFRHMLGYTTKRQRRLKNTRVSREREREKERERERERLVEPAE